MKKVIFIVFILFISCMQEKNGNSTKYSDKSKFNPTEYNGFAYIFFNEINFLDGRHLVYCLPSSQEREKEFARAKYKESFSNYPVIQIPINVTNFNKIKKGGNIQITDTLCDLIKSEMKCVRVYIEYKGFEEYFFYDQSDGNRPHQKIKQDNRCYKKWINETDSSKILKLKVFE